MAVDLGRAVRDYEARRRSLRLFDVNAWAGAQMGPHLSTLETPDDLLREMDRCCIERAVVTSTMALLTHTARGNDSLVGVLKECERLVGGYILLPTCTGEQGSNHAEDVIDRAVEDGFRLFRVFPLSMSFTLDEWCVGDLLAHLERRRLPVCVWHSETSWAQVGRLCAQYPQLPVIVEGSGRKIIYDCRTFFPLLQEYGNLFLESHGFFNYGLMEDFERREFSGRILFGTGMPFVDPHVALGLLSFADIRSAGEIAGGNFRRILEGIE